MGKGAKALPKGSKKTATKTTLSKGVAKKPAFKVALKASNLAKLGKIRLAEKIKKATEGAETAEEAAQALKGGNEQGRPLSGLEQTQDMAERARQRSTMVCQKPKKGEAVALWHVKSQGPKFQAWTEDVKATNSLGKSEKWRPEKQMLEEHSWEDFQAHLQSGRIRRREDPWTYGV